MDYTELRLREEVDFWRNLVQEWETRQSEGVRARMRETLNHAERKLERYLQDQGEPKRRKIPL